jgi:ribosomal protein L11 methylase PrmA
LPWQSVRITVNAGHAEALSEALLEQGALSVSLEDADAGTLDETLRRTGSALIACRPSSQNRSPSRTGCG